MVLTELDPSKSVDGPEIMLHTTMRGEDEKGVMRTFAVHAPTRSRSRRSILLEGFNILQKRGDVRRAFDERIIPITVNGREMIPPRPREEGTVIFIDPLIKQWLGGTRRGLLIYWELSDGYTYKYDILRHKLSRFLTGETESPNQ